MSAVYLSSNLNVCSYIQQNAEIKAQKNIKISYHSDTRTHPCLAWQVGNFLLNFILFLFDKKLSNNFITLRFYNFKILSGSILQILKLTPPGATSDDVKI